jgi:hypothetical protein
MVKVARKELTSRDSAERGPMVVSSVDDPRVSAHARANSPISMYKLRFPFVDAESSDRFRQRFLIRFCAGFDSSDFVVSSSMRGCNIGFFIFLIL